MIILFQNRLRKNDRWQNLKLINGIKLNGYTFGRVPDIMIRKIFIILKLNLQNQQQLQIIDDSAIAKFENDENLTKFQKNGDNAFVHYIL